LPSTNSESIGSSYDPNCDPKPASLFLDRYGELINLSASGQLAMRQLLDAHLARVTWDETRFPVRLRPFLVSVTASAAPIDIDPNISFGRPVISRRGISTAAIAARIDAGESPSEVAKDYELTMAEVEQAVLNGPPEIVFFTDRDLGHQFPAILRDAGLRVERHTDHCPPNCPDEPTERGPAASGIGHLSRAKHERQQYLGSPPVARRGEEQPFCVLHLVQACQVHLRRRRSAAGCGAERIVP
jgi:uncharacterized protein (DUF433 family)